MSASAASALRSWAPRRWRANPSVFFRPPEWADAIANEIASESYRRASRTSIFGGLIFAEPLFDHSGYRGLLRVIDVSGDGTNNSGPLIDAR